MIIKHRVRNLNRYAPLLANVDQVVCAIENLQNHSDLLGHLGFSHDLPEGQSVLPSASYGNSCRRNAEEWIEVHSDQPMETYYTPIIWRWRQWKGRYESEEREEMRYRPGKRYPRTVHPPIGVELVIRLKLDGSKVATLDFISVDNEHHPKIAMCINMLVEIFGECRLLTQDLDSIIQGEIRRLNWQILPPGQRPWDQLRAEILPIIENLGEGRQDVVENRLQTINHFQPEFVAIGEHGFSGYLIFGFPDRGLYLLESIFFGNATYILGEAWETLSQLTKAEILADNLHQERIIHREGWHQAITRIFS